MGKNTDKQAHAWQEVKRRCRLSDEELRMAQELGMVPRSLIKNIPNRSQPWKAPVREWIRELHTQRFGAARRSSRPALPPSARSLLPPSPTPRPEGVADEELLPQYDTQTSDFFYTRAGDGSVLSMEDAGQIVAKRDQDSESQEEDNLYEEMWDDGAETTPAEVRQQDQRMLRRQQELRQAAEAVAAVLSRLTEVEKIVLFGSVAKPLRREVPRFREFQRAGIEVFHECLDVDLAVWISDLPSLRMLQKARSQALNELVVRKNIGVAHHQVDMFLLEPRTDHYLGRLCLFGQCPKGKKECRVAGCGVVPFLQQHQDFAFHWAAAAPGSILLYTRTEPPGPAVQTPAS